MRNIVSMTVLAAIQLLSGCSHAPTEPAKQTPATAGEVLSDFATYVANPNYQDIESQARQLEQAVQALAANPTDPNLQAAQGAWKKTRQPWEQCEGFLFGPVEDFNYDPTVDSWPVNRVDLDSLLASANPLTSDAVDALPTSLKGFHPLEYILFGTGGSRKASELTEREKQYMVSLTQTLRATITALRQSWDPSQPGNFSRELASAGNGSQRFATKRDAFLAIVTSMAGICDEVANGKMQDPLAAQDSSLEESQFSHNSTTDFKNNIIGVLHAYTGTYSVPGHGISDLVAAKDISLDNRIRSQIQGAINSFGNISANYGAAVYTQKVQIQNTQNAINTLRETLEAELRDFVQTNIGD